MAPRKPNKSRRDKPNDSLANQVGGWLGGPVQAAIYSTPARAVQNLQNVAKNNPIGIAVQRAMSGAQTFRNEGYLSAVQQQAKIAAVDVAVNAAGAGVGKAAVGVGRVVAKTGVPARVVNMVTRQQVMVHGTPNQISGGFISPRAGSVASPTQPVVFGWKPTKKLAINTVNSPLEYAKGSGNVVIGKVPKSAVSVGDTDAILKSTKPVKIVGQVKAPGNFNEYDAELRRMLKRAGANIDPGLVDKAKGAAKKAKTKRANKRSTF